MNSQLYSSLQAIWAPSDPCWLSGVALNGLIDFTRKAKSTIYVDQVKDIIQAQRSQWNGEFSGESTDDTGWWALAMVHMYDHTGDSTYLNISMEDEAYMYKPWTSSPCGGGISVVVKAQSYQIAITNELYFKLAASLHNRVADGTEYLSRAQLVWLWFQRFGIINSDNLVIDGLASSNDGVCFNNKLPV